MSNIGKKKIEIPLNLEIKINKYKSFQQIVFINKTIKYITLPLNFSFKMDKHLTIEFSYMNSKEFKWLNKYYGTLNSLIVQLSQDKPYYKILSLEGVGYKVELEDKIKCSIGFSHAVYYDIPEDITINIVNNKEIHAYSESLQNLTSFLNKILQIKPAYKDKYKKKRI